VSIEYARRVRTERANLFLSLAAGVVSLREILIGSQLPLCLHEAEVYDVCISARGLGREGARQVFERADVWPHLLMCELSTQQRRAIERQLPARVK